MFEKPFLALQATALKNLQRCRLQRLKIFSVVAYSSKDFLAQQPTALKSTKWRFSGLNHPNFGFFVLVPKSPIHTGLIYVKNPKPNISSLGPFKYLCTSYLALHVYIRTLLTSVTRVPNCMGTSETEIYVHIRS